VKAVLESEEGEVSRPRKRSRKALATVSVMVLWPLLAAGGIALIWFPIQAIMEFEPSPTLRHGTSFGSRVSDTEQRNDLILDSVFLIGMGAFLLLVLVAWVRAFIGYFRE
jgi:hypothetical protein